MVSLVIPVVGAPPPEGVALAADAAPPGAPAPPEPLRAAPTPAEPPAAPPVGAPTAAAPAAGPPPAPAASAPAPPAGLPPAAPACSPVAPLPPAVKPWRGVLTEQATRASMATVAVTATARRRTAATVSFTRA